MTDTMAIINQYVKQHFGNVEFVMSSYNLLVEPGKRYALPSRGNIRTMYFLVELYGAVRMLIESDTHSNQPVTDNVYSISQNTQPYQGSVVVRCEADETPRSPSVEMGSTSPASMSCYFIRVEIKQQQLKNG